MCRVNAARNSRLGSAAFDEAIQSEAGQRASIYQCAIFAEHVEDGVLDIGECLRVALPCEGVKVRRVNQRERMREGLYVIALLASQSSCASISPVARFRLEAISSSVACISASSASGVSSGG